MALTTGAQATSAVCWAAVRLLATLSFSTTSSCAEFSGVSTPSICVRIGPEVVKTIGLSVMFFFTAVSKAMTWPAFWWLMLTLNRCMALLFGDEPESQLASFQRSESHFIRSGLFSFPDRGDAKNLPNAGAIIAGQPWQCNKIFTGLPAPNNGREGRHNDFYRRTNDFDRCINDLYRCTNDFDTCTNELYRCKNDFDTCTNDLYRCTNDFDRCINELYRCTNDLYGA